MPKTSKVGLTTNLENDPFLLTDFNNNWNILDSQPGIFPCTSSTRPSWGAAQAGRSIMETDTFRMLTWSGSTWREPVIAAPMWSLMVAPQQAISAGSMATYTMGTIKVLRPCQLILINSGQMAVRTSDGQWASFTSYVNGQAAATNTLSAYSQWPAMVKGNTTADYRNEAWFSTYSAPAAGNYTIATRANTSAGTGTVTVSSISSIVFCAAQDGGAKTA